MSITSPSYCSGREVWRLGMPRTVSPADPGLSQGSVGPLVKVAGVGTGTLALLTGAPTDSFAIRIEVGLGGALGTATARGSLDNGLTWRPTTVIPSDGVWPLDESGLVLLFTGDQTAGDVWTSSTTESEQQAQMRRAVGARIARWLRTRGVVPPTAADVGDDFREVAAVLVAEALLDGIRGFEPTTDQRRGVQARADRARVELAQIAEEMVQSDLAGQATTAGVDCQSEPPQGQGLW
jgi:hypothetical protein